MGFPRTLYHVSPYSINNNKFSEYEPINQYRELPYLENIEIHTDYRGLLCNTSPLKEKFWKPKGYKISSNFVHLAHYTIV